MDIFKVAGIAGATAALAVTVKSMKPELGVQVVLAGSALLLLITLSELSGIIGKLGELFNGFGMDGETVSLFVRVAGIAYVGQIASDVCRDAGENALASKTEICARLLIASSALPMLIRLIGLLTELINNSL